MKLPRIIVINDISGFGKCALGISLPVISACGVEALPVPTAVLSSNMKFKGYRLIDLGNELAANLSHLAELNVAADAMYTGFMTNAGEVDAVLSYMKGFGGLKLVDPIMGDNGKLYSHFTPELCEKIRALAANADIITPNLTEAYILAGREFSNDCSVEKIKKIADELRGLCKTVVITGIERGESLFNCIFDEDGCRELGTVLLPYKVGGTGDLFASIVIARLVTGRCIDDAVIDAYSFIHHTMRQSVKYEDYQNRGVCFEPYLWMLGSR